MKSTLFKWSVFNYRVRSSVAFLQFSCTCTVVLKNRGYIYGTPWHERLSWEERQFCNEKHNSCTRKTFLCLMSELTRLRKINNCLNFEQWKYRENYNITMENYASESISWKNNSFIWQCFDTIDVLLSLETFLSVFVIYYFNPYFPNRITNIEKIWCVIVSYQCVSWHVDCSFISGTCENSV